MEKTKNKNSYKPGPGTYGIHSIILLIYGVIGHQIYLDIIENFRLDSWSIIIIQGLLISLAIIILLIIMVIFSIMIQFIITLTSEKFGDCSRKNKNKS